MKKFLAIALVLSLLLSLAACFGATTDNTTVPPSETDTVPPSETDTVPASDENTESEPASEEESTAGSGSEAASAALSGKINIIDLEDRDASVLRGVRIIGNRVGTYDDINGKESSLDDVRCIFTLSEWIEFYPDTDATYGLRVWIMKHRDDQEYYNTAKFSDLDPNFANYCDLHYPEDADDPDNWYWGSFYLNEAECEAGYYDFVFTYEGKAIGVLQTRFYNENELGEKSGAELEALMHE